MLRARIKVLLGCIHVERSYHGCLVIFSNMKGAGEASDKGVLKYYFVLLFLGSFFTVFSIIFSELPKSKLQLPGLK